MTVIAYDTEFLEDGERIYLISIGLVAEDGREYYAVNSAIDNYSPDGDKALYEAIRDHDWLMKNVIPHLPLISVPSKPSCRWLFSLDRSSTLVKPKWVIANEVRDFILATPDPELWAWYCAYDHVALCQMWGPSVGRPKGIPTRTNDLKQECQRLGNPDLPRLSGTTAGMVEHNALHDAREVLYRLRWLREQHAPAQASTGLDRVAAAVRAARGDRDAPPQIQGFA
jgi:hypothetical protein